MNEVYLPHFKISTPVCLNAIGATAWRSKAAISAETYELWEESFGGLFTTIQGWKQMAGRFMTTFGMNSFSEAVVMPRLLATVGNLELGAGLASALFGGALVFGGAALATTFITQLIPWLESRNKTDLDYWSQQISDQLIYAVPAMVLGAAGSFEEKPFIRFLSDIISEPLQGIVSLGIHKVRVGLRAEKQSMSDSDFLKMQIAEGYLGMALGHAVTGAKFVSQHAGRIARDLNYERRVREFTTNIKKLRESYSAHDGVFGTFGLGATEALPPDQRSLPSLWGHPLVKNCF